MKNSLLLLLLLVASQSFAQVDLNNFFSKTDRFWKQHVTVNRVNYAAIKADPKTLNELVDFIAKTDVSANTPAQQKAYGINAYNLLVVKTAIDNYPLQKPTDVTGFFDGVKHTINGKKYTLNNFEKKELLTKYKDARLHFVLVCAAVSCPPIANFAYMPDQLEAQLDQRTKAAVDDPSFIQYDDFAGKANISEIFKWYVDDFKPNVKTFINKYRTTPLAEDSKIGYYPYNWTLNGSAASATGDNTSTDLATDDSKPNFEPIIVAATMPKGKFELNTFHTFYNADYEQANAKFSGYGGLFLFSYGVNGRFDVGVDFILKSNRFGDRIGHNPFASLDFQRGEDTESQPGQTISRDWGLSQIGPRVRFAPFKKFSMSFEQAIYFPITGLPVDNTVDPSLFWVTQIFYDHQFNAKFSLFGAVTFWQPIRPGEQFKFQVPYPKLFFSWFTTKRFTLYATTTAFTEWGGGAKFLITPNFEVQALYTYFIPIPGLTELYTGTGASNVMSFNIGIRYRS
jgi:hypothetical protein